MKRIFIVGYMHSGTSMLQSVIGKNSKVFNTAGESKYFESLSMLRRRFGSPERAGTLQALVVYLLTSLYDGRVKANGTETAELPGSVTPEEVAEIMGRLERPATFCSVFRDVADWTARQEGCDAWLEKTPSHILHVDDIMACMPDAKIIEIVRDPRDILASKKTRRDTVWTTERYEKEERQKKHWEKAYDPLWDTLSWRAFIRAGMMKRATYADNFYTVTYEKLTAEPEKAIAEISAFLGLAYEPRMLDVDQGVPADLSEERGEGITTRSLGRWKKVLSFREVALSQHLVAKELDHYGYPRIPVPFISRLGGSLLCFKSAAELVVRLYRRWKLGGVPLLRKTLAGYVKRFRYLR